MPPATGAHLMVDPQAAIAAWALEGFSCTAGAHVALLLGHTTKSTTISAQPETAFQGETLIWGSALYTSAHFHRAYKNFHYFFHLITLFVKPYWSQPTNLNIFCGWQKRDRQRGNSYELGFPKTAG